MCVVPNIILVQIREEAIPSKMSKLRFHTQSKASLGSIHIYPTNFKLTNIQRLWLGEQFAPGVCTCASLDCDSRFEVVFLFWKVSLLSKHSKLQWNLQHLILSFVLQLGNERLLSTLLCGFPTVKRPSVCTAWRRSLLPWTVGWVRACGSWLIFFHQKDGISGVSNNESALNTAWWHLITVTTCF